MDEGRAVKYGDASAFPVISDNTIRDWGLSRRAFFAAMALQGDWASQAGEGWEPFSERTSNEVFDERAQSYVRAADALIRELVKERAA